MVLIIKDHGGNGLTSTAFDELLYRTSMSALLIHPSSKAVAHLLKRKPWGKVLLSESIKHEQNNALINRDA